MSFQIYAYFDQQKNLMGSFLMSTIVRDRKKMVQGIHEKLKV